ncbi:MAG: ABC transporter permease [Gudongella sp.]|jgi:putative ABC transport system permease protein|nr:ABC transporter permease [Gudongella sp.]
MKKLDLRLFRFIKNSKGQFISVSVTIAAALIIFVSFSMVAKELGDSIEKYYDETNFSHITISVSKIPVSDMQKLYDIDGIKEVQGRVVVDVPLRVEDPDEKVTVRLVSVPSDGGIVNKLYLINGDIPDEDVFSTAVLQQFYIARNLIIGDVITPYIGGRVYPLRIIGEVGNPEYIYLTESAERLLPDDASFGVIYVTEEFAQSALGYSGSYNDIAITVSPEYEDDLDSITNQLEDVLKKYGIISITKRDNQLSHVVMVQKIDSQVAMSAALSIVFLFISATITSIMLSRLVKKDRMAIGVLKGLGYSDRTILLHYAKYSALIGLTGAIFGLVFSIPVTIMMINIFLEYMNMPLLKVSIDIIYLIYGVALTAIFSISAGLFGSREVMKITPADAMRPEPPKIGRRIYLEKFENSWRKINFSWKMVIRSMLRNKRRVIFFIFAISLTFAIVLVPVYMGSIWDTLFDSQYGKLQKMDHSIDFAQPLSHRGVFEITQLSDIRSIEPKIEVPVQVKKGLKKESVNAIAISSDTEMFGFADESGKALILPENGVLLSTLIAKRIDANIGDFIELKTFLPDAEDQMLEVKGIVEQFIGSGIYMDIEQMYRIFGEKNIATGAYAKSDVDLALQLKDVEGIRSVQSTGDMQEMILEYTEIMMISLGVLILLGGVLAFAIVYNITTVTINERIMEFSSLRVMGFKKNEIYRLIARENALMSVAGIILGIPVGYATIKSVEVYVSTDMYIIPAIVLPSTYIIAIIATVIFIVIAQIATYRRIHHLNFIDALKNRVS